VQIRNRGTVGGSIAHADPAAELAAVATLLDAEMTLVSTRGSRRVRADEFFAGMMTTVIEPDELLAEIRFPELGDDATWGFSEYAQRQGDFALAGAACVLSTSEARIVAFGAGDRALRCPAAEQLVMASNLDTSMVSEAAEQAMREVSERTDVYSDEAAYRVRMTRPMVERALRQALQQKGAAA
jgi:CO/xanthine dehydrogenase FAD-binding subunit